jgi:hypothetical protein
VASLGRLSAAPAFRLARSEPFQAAPGVTSEPAPVVAAQSPMRVEAAAADGGGLVETVLGSLLGFFL